MTLDITVKLLGVLTVLLALFQGYDWWKKRQSKSSVDVVTSAVQLLRPYQEEVDRLRSSLQTAHIQIIDLTDKLTAAETRADSLNNRLVDAQTEVKYLRTQVKTLSQMLGDGNESSR